MSTAFQARTPDQKLVATIIRVEQRTVPKTDGTQFTMYDVFVNEQAEPFNTTKKDIAESAHSLTGQLAEISYNVKVNGRFTNYWINSALPGPVNPAVVAQRAAEAQPVLAVAAGLPAPAALGTGVPGATQQTPMPLVPPPTPIGGAIPQNTSKDEAIHRQTAAKVAATIHAASPSSAADFWENCAKLAHYFDTGELPQSGLDVDDDSIPFE